MNFRNSFMNSHTLFQGNEWNFLNDMYDYVENDDVIVGNVMNNQTTTGIFLIKGHTLYQCNELSSFKEMDKDVENSDVSCGHFLMNTQNISKANNMSSIYSTKKRDVNVTNVLLFYVSQTHKNNFESVDDDMHAGYL